MLLERDRQLGDLTAFADDAVADGGGVVLIAGEAGIGKTSLVHEFVGERREPVLIGRCEPLTTPRPLQALHDLAHQSGGRLAALMASDAGRHDRFTALLDRLAASPTVAVVEDVHWADEATLDLLVFLGRRLSDTRSLLLLTLREPTTEAPPALAEVLGHLATGAPRFLRIDLAPLSVDAVAVLAGGRSPTAAHVHAVTAGNPFFVTEVLASGDDEVPATVKDAVLGRVARLGDGARAALEAAAVVPDRSSSPCCTTSAAPLRPTSRSASGSACSRSGRASRRTATSSRASPSSTACPPYGAGSCTEPSWPTCSPAPATWSPGSPTTPTSPATPPRS